jgi:uncharacterized protein (TIRG00374 family)
MKKFLRGKLKYVLNLVILVGVIVAGVKYISGQEVLEALRTFDYRYAPFMLALSLAYFGLKTWRFVILAQPIARDLPWWVTAKIYVAGEAAALLPGGVAARAGMMNQLDVPLGKGSIPVLFNSLLDQTVLITGALIVALWFERSRTPVLIVLGIFVFIGLLLLIPTSRAWIMRAGKWVADKFNVRDEWRTFVKNLPKEVTFKRMASTLALTMAAFACHILALDLALRGVGASLSYAGLAMAYFLPTVLGRLSGLPAGIGVTEAGMTGFLTSISDIGPNTAIAAVTIFRIATTFFAVLISALVYFFGWNGERELEQSPSSS